MLVKELTIHLQAQRFLSRTGGVDLTRSCLRVFPCVFGCLYMHVFHRQADAKYFFRDCLHRSSRRAVHLLSRAARLLSSCKNHLGTLQEALQPLLAARLMVVNQQNTTPTQTQNNFSLIANRHRITSSLHGYANRPRNCPCCHLSASNDKGSEEPASARNPK